MKKMILVVMACMLFSTAGFASTDVSLPGTLKAGETDLILNGSGVRSKLFIDLYMAGLYVPQKTSDVGAVLQSDTQVGIKLHIISKLITSEKMSSATREGFEKSTRGNMAPIQKEIDDMINIFSSEIKVNDVYDMVYEPGVGTKIFKNGTFTKTIPGEAFKKAFFGIWLGDDPVQKKLKKQLAGS